MIVPAPRLLFWVSALLPVAALAGMVPGIARPGAVIAAAFAAALAADAVAAVRRQRQVRVSLPESVRMSVDRPAGIPVTLHRAGSGLSSVTLGLPLPPSMEAEHETLRVDLPQEAADSRVRWSCTPRQRGRFTLSRCFHEIASPLGFWNARGCSPCRSEIRIYPNLAKERRRLAAVFLRRGHFGIHAQRMVGQGREFEKLRDYLPGDNYEDIHWKATAKRGHPITKLYQVERTREIYVAVDTSRLSARLSGAEPALERFITSALALGLVAEQQGDRFGLLTFGARVHRFLRAGSGRAHYHACRDVLFSLDSEPVTPDFHELFSFIRLRIRRRALILFLTDLGDPLIAETFLKHIDLICRKHLALAACILPPGIGPLYAQPDVKDVEDLYARLGGHLVWHGLKELETSLGHRGVQLSLVSNEQLTGTLVTRYMNVKARQVL